MWGALGHENVFALCAPLQGSPGIALVAQYGREAALTKRKSSNSKDLIQEKHEDLDLGIKVST